MDEQPTQPPDDADEWTSEQWIDWLKATDVNAAETEPAGPTTGGSRVAHSTGGQVLGNAMMGLAQALYGRTREEPAIVIESGQPDEEGFDLHLDYDHPERSYATKRPASSAAPESESDEV